MKHAEKSNYAVHRRKKGARIYRFGTWIISSVLKTTLIMVLLILCGFGYYIHVINNFSWDNSEKADGIVVLTGGSYRVAEAYALMSAGYGKRLLISGVNTNTDRKELLRLFPDYSDLIECCVDLDYQAENTAGNARETMEWVKKNNFNSIIVVTSNYHMPRSLAEIRHALKGKRIIPYPIISPNIDTRNWWQREQWIKLLSWEYLKYLYVVIRTSFNAQAEVSAPVHSGQNEESSRG